MNIDYDMNKNYKKLYNEANGLYACKNKLEKMEKCKTFLQLQIISFMKIEILGIVFFALSFFLPLRTLKIASFCFLGIGIFYILISIFVFYQGVHSKKNSKSGTLRIEEDGLFDKSSSGNKVKVFYRNIETMVITKNIILFITNTPIMVFIPNKNKKEILSKIKEYSSLKIVDMEKD